MNAFTVYKVCEHNSKQLLIVQDQDNPMKFSLCVYDEHTGTTLMRLTQPTVDEFDRALQLLKADV